MVIYIKTIHKILLYIFLKLKFYKRIKILKEINTTSIVNKNNKLDRNYVPPKLERISKRFSSKRVCLVHEARINFEKMCITAKKEGLDIVAVSAYRDYYYQENLYNNYLKEKGKFYADLCSARPGHSEHQTGLAVDISNKDLDYDNFDKTKEFNWVINKAHKYGFILRYPKNKTHITGFKYEPWHYRYIGTEIAYIINKRKIALEEFYKNRK